MSVFLRTADSLLRDSHHHNLNNKNSATTLHSLYLRCTIVLIFGLFYGATMGSYAGISIDRWLHLLFTALKVPLLLGATFLLSLPSFAVINYLFGLGADLRSALRIMLSCQAVVALALASLAPFTALWYFSVRDYKMALLFNAIIYAIASLAGQYAIRRSYRSLIARNVRHRYMLWIWIGLYSFVGIQLAWVLRPFVGSPTELVQFIRTEELSNAYVRIAQLLWAAIAGD